MKYASLFRCCDLGTKTCAATLVEVLVAMVILLAVVVGAGAMLYFPSGDIAIQKNKRVTLEVANARLERLSGADYDNITPLAYDYSIYYINGSDWFVYETDPGETVNINGIDMPMTTMVQYVDDDGGTDSYDYLRLEVQVGFRPDSNQRVSLVTYVPEY